MDWKETITQEFSSAIDLLQLEQRVKRYLIGRGYNGDNTRFGHSVCRDEVNSGPARVMMDFWGESYVLGGLGGLPTAGIAGFNSFYKNRPDDGNLLILFGPHIGVDNLGRLGHARRRGGTNSAPTCGTLQRAMDMFSADPKEAGALSRELNGEQIQVKEDLAPFMGGIQASKLPIKTATESAYQVIEKRVFSILEAIAPTCEVALLGGIIINTPSTSDYFDPRRAIIMNPKDTGGKEIDWLSQIGQEPLT
jgi:hypothetical protein